jgi:hypothetical protein
MRAGDKDRAQVLPGRQDRTRARSRSSKPEHEHCCFYMLAGQLPIKVLGPARWRRSIARCRLTTYRLAFREAFGDALMLSVVQAACF